VRVEVAAEVRRAARARAAVHDERGFPGRVPAGLPVDLVPVADVEQPVLVRFDLGVQPSHQRVLPPEYNSAVTLAVSAARAQSFSAQTRVPASSISMS